MKKEHISDLMLERYLLKELPEKQIAYIDNLLEQMPDLQTRIDSLKKSNKDILHDYPADVIVPEINRKRELIKTKTDYKSSVFSRISRKRIVIPSFALATAIISLLFIIPAIKTSLNYIPTDHPNYNTRIKGNESKIFIYRKLKNEVEVLKNDSLAKKGDLLQIAYVSAKDKYGIILSIDGRGTATLHFPLDITAPANITTGKKVLLSNSYELDDAPDFEKFYFITSEDELDVASVFHSAQLLANDKKKVLNEKVLIINKDNSINQASVLINKVR